MHCQQRPYRNARCVILCSRDHSRLCFLPYFSLPSFNSKLKKHHTPLKNCCHDKRYTFAALAPCSLRCQYQNHFTWWHICRDTPWSIISLAWWFQQWVGHHQHRRGTRAFQCLWCEAQGVYCCCLGINLECPNDAPGTAQGMFLFTSHSPAIFSSGKLTDRGGEDAHTSNAWYTWMRDCSNLLPPAHAVSWCHAQVWSH